MNERIKELERQATSYMPGRPPYDGLTFDMFDKEKFAELIVRECLDILDDEDDGSTDTKSVRIAAYCIKKNFGVEE